MKLFEFASAQEQLALWKVISDNIWDTIEEQARLEREEKAKSKPPKPMRQPRDSQPPKAQSSPPVPVLPPKKAENLDDAETTEEMPEFEFRSDDEEKLEKQ